MQPPKTIKYPIEYKKQAVKLAREIGAHQACQDLGMASSTLYKWVKLSQQSHLELNSEVHVLDIIEENKQLKKTLARVEEEREILKKATRFFAREKS